MALAWLKDLNPAQRQAVTFGDGTLLVVAGAGTGKTKTLACRVAFLLERGIDPGRVLLLTFTRRAAAEMISRADHMSGRGTAGKLWAGTFHAVAHRLLRLYGRSIGLADGFSVMDQDDAADLMQLIRLDLGVAKGDRRFPQKATLARMYSHTVNAQRPLREVVERYFPWCAGDLEAIGAIFARYGERKIQQRLLDYDDLLLFWKTLCSAPVVGRNLADRFDHILVDEYQDTNALQADILRGMRQSHEDLMAVGDDAQSIYSFRAATVRNMLEFPERFPGARVVTLEQNYRSTGPILAASNAVMSFSKERYTKELWSQRRSEQRPVLVTCRDEEEQTGMVCRHILEHLEQGVPLSEQAVLFRAGHHSAMLEVELARRNIPFHKFGGLKFLEAAHIKDLLAFLRILENPFDELSWFRVLLLLPGIGPRTARRILDQLGRPGRVDDAARCNGGGRTRLASPLCRLLREPPAVPAGAKEHFGALRSALADCEGVPLPESSSASGNETAVPSGKGLPVRVQIERIGVFYRPIFERRYENAAMRLRDLEQLEQIAARYRSRRQFITDLTLDPPTATSDLAGAPHRDEDYLTLSTIHSAKGCEWHSVHVLHAADGMIPSDMATGDDAGIEEERRLLYVAMTRAKDVLYVYFPLRYYHRRWAHGDAHGYAQLTRFIPSTVRALFEQRVDRAEVDPSSDRPADVRNTQAGLNRLWNC